MSVAQRIESKLQDGLQADFLQIDNESHMHGGPATESHFKVTLVSPQFAGQSRVARHQKVYALLADELTQGVHALALHLYAPNEWGDAGHSIPVSPDCRGGSKVD